MSQVKALNALLELISDDGYAISFRSLTGYRRALSHEVKRQIRGLNVVAVTGNAEPKFHYYSFAFATDHTRASVYIGYSDQVITMSRIAEAKKAASVSCNSVLLSCCYLGHMTRHEMTGEQA